MISSLRRLAALGALTAALLSPLGAAPVAGAAAAGIVPSILIHTGNYLTNVRTYFLCNTAKCKKERALLVANALSSMTSLNAQAAAASSAHLQSKFQAPIKLFVSDVGLLAASYREYFTTTSTVTLSGLVGNIFYLTSDVGSDVNILRAAEKNTPVSFNPWVEGEAATLVAMQTDANALQSASATVAIGIYANQLLEAESRAMLAHASGPNASFNAMLQSFAHNQLRISESEVLFLQGKKAPMTETQVANLNVTVAAEFAQLIKTETSLVKNKK